LPWNLPVKVRTADGIQVADYDQQLSFQYILKGLVVLIGPFDFVETFRLLDFDFARAAEMREGLSICLSSFCSQSDSFRKEFQKKRVRKTDPQGTRPKKFTIHK